MPGTARRERAARLRMAGTRARHLFFAGRVGASTEVLVEGEAVGRCPWYAPVSLGASIAGGAEPGTLAPVRINAADEERLYAESVS